MSRFSAPLTALILAFALALPVTAQAASPALEGAPVIRHARKMHQGRHGVTPSLGYLFAHPYRSHLVFDLRYDYYMADWIALGVDLGYAFGFNTALAKSVEELRGDFRTTEIGYNAMAGITLAPLYGKFVWRNAGSVRYDTFLRLHGGAVQLRGDGRRIPTGVGFAPRVGLGGHIFMGEQAALMLEISDTMASMHRSTTVAGGVLAKELHHLLTFQVGVLVHFPEAAEIGR